MPRFNPFYSRHYSAISAAIIQVYGRQLLWLFLVLAGLLLAVGPASPISRAANPDTLNLPPLSRPRNGIFKIDY